MRKGSMSCAKLLCTLSLCLLQSLLITVKASNYNLTFAVDGGVGGTVELMYKASSGNAWTTVSDICPLQTISIYVRTSAMMYTAYPADGYEFDHWEWYINKNSVATGLDPDLELVTSTSNPSACKQLGNMGGSESGAWMGTTVTAFFRAVAPATHTVTVTASPAGYGTVTQATVTDVPHGTTITNSTNTVTINGTTVTATPTASNAQYTYAFSGWTNGTATVNDDLTVTANFTRTTNNYTVAASVTPVGAGSVSGTGSFAYGTDVTLTATPTNRRYRFVRWTESASEVATTASYTINSINAAHTLVAEFEEIPVTLDDNGTSDYYTATLSTFNTETDFQLMRTFYAGMWNTVCFPFALSASQIAASDMSGATFYTLTSVTGDAAEGLDFNVSEVTSLSARTPYLVQVSGSNIVNPVFEGVTLDANAFTNNTTGQSVGETKFFGTVHPTLLEIGSGSGFLFLGQNNTLYWPNVAHDIRAFRAYFYSGSNAVQAVHPRVRIVLQNETTTGIEEVGASGESGVSGKSGLSGASVKKYLRNGSLVIERDGIRYNAVGEQIK